MTLISKTAVFFILLFVIIYFLCNSFYYGSHYSSMGIVLFYLLRLEPFTALHRSLQVCFSYPSTVCFWPYMLPFISSLGFEINGLASI